MSERVDPALMRDIALGQLDAKAAMFRETMARQAVEAEQARASIARAVEAIEVQPRILRMSDVKPERVRWLWHGRLAYGNFSILDGDPGLGKSTLTVEIAARLSRGELMPGEPIGTPKPEPANTLILTFEDSLATVMRPRLDAAGADPDRVLSYNMVHQDGLPSLDKDIERIERDAEEFSASLIVVDPLMAAVGKADSHKDQDIRRVLSRVQALAQKLGAAVLLVRHMNKSNVGSALYRGGGSIGIIGAARVGLMFAKDPNDPEKKRVLAVTKCNIARMAPSLSLQITDADGVGRIEWLGPSELGADDLVQASRPQQPEEKSSLDAAKDAVRQILANGPVNVKDAEALAKDAGVHKRTFERARRELGVVCRQSADRKAWRIWLPDADS